MRVSTLRQNYQSRKPVSSFLSGQHGEQIQTKQGLCHGSILCSFIKTRNIKKTQKKSSFGVTVNKAFSYVCLRLHVLSVPSPLSPARPRSLSPEVPQAAQQRLQASALGLRDQRLTSEPGTRIRPTALYGSRWPRRRHCSEQEAHCKQQHTEELMALGGIRSRSSSSGISSKR